MSFGVQPEASDVPAIEGIVGGSSSSSSSAAAAATSSRKRSPSESSSKRDRDEDPAERLQLEDEHEIKRRDVDLAPESLAVPVDPNQNDMLELDEVVKKVASMSLESGPANAQQKKITAPVEKAVLVSAKERGHADLVLDHAKYALELKKPTSTKTPGSATAQTIKTFAALQDGEWLDEMVIDRWLDLIERDVLGQYGRSFPKSADRSGSGQICFLFGSNFYLDIVRAASGIGMQESHVVKERRGNLTFPRDHAHRSHGLREKGTK